MNHLIILIAAVLTHVLTHLLVPLNIKFSLKKKLVAVPGERHIHKKVTPLAGGLSFALPMLAILAVLGIVFISEPEGIMLLQLSGVGIIVLIIGLLDDRYDSNAWVKFFAQLGIALVMYLIGFRVIYLTNPFGEDFTLAGFSLPLTILWYLVMMNAINLIDGMDGLATGIAAIVSGVLLIVGIKHANMQVTLLSSMLFAGTLAFLRYNFHPAKIFLGDTGSLFIGFIIAAISTTGNQQFKGITSITLMIPLTVMAVPILDVVLAVFRRISVGNIFKPDKSHIHHVLLELGLSQKTVALIVYFVTLLFGLIAIGFSFSSSKILFSVLMFISAFAIVTWYLVMSRRK